MAETKRRPVPRSGGTELEVAMAFLDFQREAVLRCCAGLDEGQLREIRVPSGTNLLGLVRHLTDGEAYWFAHHVAGEPVADTDWEMTVPDDVDADEVFSAFRRASERSNEILRAVGDLSAPMAVLVDGAQLPVRWAVAHVTAEIARHAGHADIIREQIDGTTGR